VVATMAGSKLMWPLLAVAFGVYVYWGVLYRG
jgi:hypothetical protein